MPQPNHMTQLATLLGVDEVRTSRLVGSVDSKRGCDVEISVRVDASWFVITVPAAVIEDGGAPIAVFDQVMVQIEHMRDRAAIQRWLVPPEPRWSDYT